MSPPLLDIRRLPYEERQIDIVTELEDLRALVRSFVFLCLYSAADVYTSSQIAQRRSVASSRFVPRTAQAVQEQPTTEAASNADLVSEALFRAEAERELDEEEELFNVEEDIAHPTSYNWEDKWRPRKPRYFNRVHTGYEWNKYNQTHYESVFILFSDACLLLSLLSDIVFVVRTTRLRRWYKVTRHVLPSLPSSSNKQRDLIDSPFRFFSLAVQHILPRLNRQIESADVQNRQGARQRRNRAAALHSRAAVRRYRVQNRQPRMGVLT